MEIDRDGNVVVRAPMGFPDWEIRRILQRNSAWVKSAQEKTAERNRLHPEPTEEERKQYIQRARKEIPQKVDYYSSRLNVHPTGISITSARTRFGSCSSKNRLSFSWRLMAYPEEAIDYVVVHELAHILHHDHSRAFYAVIESVMPDHKELRKLLKQ